MRINHLYTVIIVTVCLCVLSAPLSFGGEDDIRMWPLVHYMTGKDSVKFDLLWPLFSIQRSPEKSRFALRPLYGRYDDSEMKSVDVLWPIVHSAEWKNKDRAYFRFLPVVMEHNEKSKSFNLIPLLFLNYGDPDESATIITPFFYVRDEDSVNYGLFPFLFIGKDKVQIYSTLFPLYFSKKEYSDTEKSDLQSWYRVVFPFVWSSGNARKKCFTLFPLYKHRENPAKNESKTSFLWKVYNSKRKGDYKLTEMMPFWSYERNAEKKHFSILWRFYASHKEEGNNYIRFLYFFKANKK